MDDDLRRRVQLVEDGVHSLRDAVQRAQRTADVALERLEESMRSDVAEAARLNGRFTAQDAELTKQTKMLGDLADAERRRTQRSLAMAAVDAEEDRRKKSREDRLDRALKWWPIFVTVVPATMWLAAWLAQHWK